MSLRGCGVFIPLTLAIFRPRALDSKWAVASMILSIGSAAMAGLIHTVMSPVFVGLGVSLAVVLLGSVWKRMRRRHAVPQVHA